MSGAEALVLAVVASGLAYLIGSRLLRARVAAYGEPVVLPKAMRAVEIAGSTLLPGSIYPIELRRPESHALFSEARKKSFPIGIAPRAPASGSIVCAARVTESRQEGATFHAVVQGVARIRLVAQRPSGEWSIELFADSAEAKEQARLAAEELRELALRAIERQEPFPGAIQGLRSASDVTELVDLAAASCGLPPETQAVVLTTEELSARVTLVRRSIGLVSVPSTAGGDDQ
jgi:hypothetical protein